MKLKFLMLAMMLALATVARGATNDLTGLLQKGLFEEEANRDLPAAIANYQSLASAFDKDRQLAATAIFRLGECYRKLNKTNEASAEYQRIIKEFSDQDTLVTLSRQNLAGLGGGAAVAASNPIVSEQVRQLEWVKKLQAMPLSEVRQVAPTVLTDATLINLIYQYNQGELDLIRLRVDHGEEQAEVKKEKAIQAALQDKIKERLDGMSRALTLETEQSASGGGNGPATLSDALLRLQIERTREQIASDLGDLQELSKMFLPTNARVVDLKKRIDAENASLALLEEKLQASQGVAAEGGNPVTTDEEQQEIRRIQLMIQNSPDLINAPDGDGNTPLIVAATKGQMVVAKYLLDHGADVNASTRNHFYVALSAAAKNGHKAMVELLLSRGADVNGRGGVNPLIEAVQNGYMAVAEVLLANKADVNSPSVGGPVIAAVENGQTELLKLLIQHGAEVNARNANTWTALEIAAGENNTNAAKLLLASKADINAKDRSGNTPLHEAARAGKAEMTYLLLDSGATVDPTNSEDTTPLMLAVANDRTSATRVLCQHKADPNREGRGPDPFDQNQWKRSLPILFAIWKGNDDIVKLLLDSGANPNRDWQYEVPLFTAIQHNRVDAVQTLLEHGADPNSPDRDGSPPLSKVLTAGRDKRIVRLLLDKGADASAKDKDGYIPLTRTSDPEVGRWLVGHKANVNARFQGQLTPLMTGYETNYVRFLLEAGAKPDLQDTNGNTALHHRTISAQLGAVAVLLEYKANPNIQNNAGYTPLDLAKSGSINGVVEGGLWTANSAGIGVNRAYEKDIADLLIQAGGLANLPKRNRIEVRRASTGGMMVFTKDSHGWNRYSLLELVAGEYGLLSQNVAGEWDRYGAIRELQWAKDLHFPDFKNVIIYRRTEASAKQKAIDVNVEDILNSGDCSRDMWLEWGDVVEIPESDHPVDQHWPGLMNPTVTALTNCLARQVTVTVKGVRTTLQLKPEFTVQSTSTPAENDRLEVAHASFMLRSVLDNSKLVRVSSDLSRVKVTRIDPETKKKMEWTIDCTNPTQADLWLRDGDVIDVPEK